MQSDIRDLFLEIGNANYIINTEVLANSPRKFKTGTAGGLHA